MYTYLKAPNSYRLASSEKKKAVCNGAGPRGLGWLVPDTLWGLRIREAANIHDWQYYHGFELKDKEEADLTFLANMLRIIRRETTTKPIMGCLLRKLRRRRAFMYFEMVEEIGSKYFLKAREGFLLEESEL